MSGLTTAVTGAAGSSHSMALLSSGAIWAWGDNGFGQLGDGTTTQRLTPVQLTTLSNVTGISTRSTASYAVTSDGTVWSWG